MEGRKPSTLPLVGEGSATWPVTAIPRPRGVAPQSGVLAPTREILYDPGLPRGGVAPSWRPDTGRNQMSKEFFWPMLTIVLTGLMWIPYILDRAAGRGMADAMGNPGADDKPQSPWAHRMMAAHANAVENLVLFAPLVLVAN